MHGAGTIIGAASSTNVGATILRQFMMASHPTKRWSGRPEAVLMAGLVIISCARRRGRPPLSAGVGQLRIVRKGGEC